MIYPDIARRKSSLKCLSRLHPRNSVWWYLEVKERVRVTRTGTNSKSGRIESRELVSKCIMYTIRRKKQIFPADPRTQIKNTTCTSENVTGSSHASIWAGWAGQPGWWRDAANQSTARKLLLYEFVDDLWWCDCREGRYKALKRGQIGFKKESVQRETASRSAFVGQRELRLFCFSSLFGGFVGGPQRRSQIALKGHVMLPHFHSCFLLSQHCLNQSIRRKMFDVHLLMDTSFRNSHRSLYNQEITCAIQMFITWMLLTWFTIRVTALRRNTQCH